ncbi:MAG: ATP-dependent Clp protease adaptor ClpS [Flavobacteriaceae bacterium]|nr:ATP-dependent Clp protease adaptor ClpS [Flavobacteriaceae bacterium]
MSTREKVEELVLTDTESSEAHHLVLYNDDFNTFDHVIFTLIKVCEHSAEQAEQCSLIVHYKGKCTVKSGGIEDLKPRCQALLDAGLSAKIN